MRPRDARTGAAGGRGPHQAGPRGRPPRVAEALLRQLVPASFRDAFLGDLEEAWVERCGRRGRLVADLAYWKEVLACRPLLLRHEAQAEVSTMAERLAEAYPDTNLGTLRDPDHARPVTLVPVRLAAIGPGSVGLARLVARLLMTVVAFVLLIACANVANLVLSRGTARQHEVAVRQALGAGRGRLLRQLLTESLLLAAAGGAAGLLLAVWLRNAMTALDLGAVFGVPSLPEMPLDATVLGYCMAVSLLTGLLFGLVPAMRASRADTVGTLRATDGVRAGGSRRLPAVRNLLVVSQVALSLVLLIGAGLFVRSLQNVLDIDPGFDPEGVLAVSLDLSLENVEPQRGMNFWRGLLERARALPGVSSAALAMYMPVDPAGSRTTIEIEGHAPAPGEDMELNFNVVSEGYFETLGIPLRRGRVFEASDGDGAEPVVVVNETFARRYWPRQDAVGNTVTVGGLEPRVARVVGVVADGKYRDLREQPLPYFYRPLRQVYVPSVDLMVRTGGDSLEQLPAVRAAVREIDPDLPVLAPRSAERQIAEALAAERTAAVLLGTLALVALLLAAVGLYGVVSYNVEHRTREIGVRITLGADAADVLRMVVGRGMLLVIFGVAAGLGGAFLLAGVTEAMLFETSPTDPLTFAVVPVVLATVALVAALLPARRATRVDPIVALRSE